MAPNSYIPSERPTEMQSTQPSAEQLQMRKNKLGPWGPPGIRLPAPEGVRGRGSAVGSWGKANISAEEKHLNLLQRARCQKGLPVVVVVVVLAAVVLVVLVVEFSLSVPLRVSSAKTLNPKSPHPHPLLLSPTGSFNGRLVGPVGNMTSSTGM